ncbi:hypothetical protein PSTG_05599 [Puccinia striiformis f. sp. tritici PST-78]|uniref:F-box domain-containing protein n=1 Tax=Puccinia striiformis f. sp. tritici PST-78 TaxID=1165861 RepID=A0A0L0VPV4_9BASI|nr:hypothetical protein PSTG_05599 [Puccinia striiformis f. sp. tritici PST-78]
MTGILDLPPEIFGRMFIHVKTPDREWYDDRGNQKCRTDSWKLRLVCRQWSDWLYEDHLYRELKFESADRATRFIEILQRRSKLLPRPKCRQLWLSSLRPGEGRLQPAKKDVLTCPIAARLIGLFSDTINTLLIEPTDLFKMSPPVIKAIKDMTNLRDLRISCWKIPEERLAPPDLECFNDLVVAAHRLESLHLETPIRLTFVSNLLPAITYLEVDITSTTSDTFTDLAIALKPSLRVLELNSYDALDPDDIPQLLPAFEALRETLEAISLTSTRLLEPLLELSFPKLRVLSVSRWFEPTHQIMCRTMFTKAPIEVIAMASDEMHWEEPGFQFPLDLFSNMPKLRKLVFMDATPDFETRPIYHRPCEAHNIECVAIDHYETLRIMKY